MVPVGRRPAPARTPPQVRNRNPSCRPERALLDDDATLCPQDFILALNLPASSKHQFLGEHAVCMGPLTATRAQAVEREGRAERRAEVGTLIRTEGTSRRMHPRSARRKPLLGRCRSSLPRTRTFERPAIPTVKASAARPMRKAAATAARAFRGATNAQSRGDGRSKPPRRRPLKPPRRDGRSKPPRRDRYAKPRPPAPAATDVRARCSEASWETLGLRVKGDASNLLGSAHRARSLR